MQRLRIDFVQPPLWRLPGVGRDRQILLALSALAALAGVVLAWHWLDTAREIDEAKQAIAVARQELVQRTPPPAPPLLLSELQVRATNSAIAQLNTPWPAVLDGFERVATGEVALLQIEPDHRRGLVKGVAEAKSHQQMLLYLAVLGAVDPFAGAMVRKQEVNEKDANRPLRFMFEALLEEPAIADAPAIPDAAASVPGADDG
ncbi:hypothetical protein [Accumulibacter sp.]|uniref:hypothetical protein n=1 Tax=Accumulibacter sp. TaxID=2053492 RepID=UPI001A3F6A62|nr:hypothetical protein [Accumulibacter sp.]MBL8374162.1 hypothetical protein [Accumulibacter sp.]